MIAPAIADGKVYVNNGFWDTYRTAWSAYSLLAPKMAGELVDGFVQQYRDGGWISRWSSPGYANLMTGTSSDVSFADAYVKDIEGFDARDAYDAALKNATVVPPGSANNPSVGRKGITESLFLGYTTTDVSEGVSWALEGYINDFGIANMAERMARERGLDRDERERFREEQEYFINRARNYVNMFDSRIGFFQGRDREGRFKSAPRDYDPRVWGHDHDYTETNGWNFAFHAPQDGQGLANLYGGRDELADKLDEFFATPETAKFPGSYGGIIHEMVEARDVRMGQWGFSNQVSHHIPWMYDYAGQPYKTQRITREVLRRMYIGSEIGQGYAGDEDNGETSAWYLFSALGFYPLQVGSPYYAIGSPLFKKATVNLPNGREIVVSAPDNSRENVYVDGLRIDGRRHDKAYLEHDDIANGARLTFDMDDDPSRWATSRKAAPPSISDDDGDDDAPLWDATERDATNALFDDTSATRETLAGPVSYEFDERREVRFYTLTSAETEGADPSSWEVFGSNDGRKWKELDDRRGERVPVAPAVAAVQARQARRLPPLPDRVPRPGGAARRGRAADGRAAGGDAARGRGRGRGRAPRRDRDREGDRLQLGRREPERPGHGVRARRLDRDAGVGAVRADRQGGVRRGDVRGDGAGRHRARHVPDRVHRDRVGDVRAGVGERERHRRRGRVHAGHRRRGAVAVRRRRLAAQRRGLRRPRAVRRQRALLRLPLPDPGGRDRRHAAARPAERSTSSRSRTTARPGARCWRRRGGSPTAPTAARASWT